MSRARDRRRKRRLRQKRRQRLTISITTLQGVLILALLAGGFGVLLAYNAHPAKSFDVPSGPILSPTPTPVNWQGIVATQFLLNATLRPTTDATAAAAYQPPTPDWEDRPPEAFQPGQIAGIPRTPTRRPTFAAATEPEEAGTRTPGPSPTFTITPILSAATATPTPRSEWNPPEIDGPLALDPRDHFWLRRPIRADRVNYGLVWYHYGSDGLEDDMRVHRGEDFGNPRGVRVLAAGDGTVIWADEGIETTRILGDRILPEIITSYGNVMVIEHDFSYKGEPIYTLYAHLMAFTKEVGDHVKAGETIALVGATGLVGGPHLHLEVRIGWNSYQNTRNPYLWIAPYVGHGVIAGRVLDLETDEYVQDNLVTLIDKATGTVVRRYTTYGSGVHPDDEWQENFLFGDVPAGTYEVVTWVQGLRLVAEAEVVPGTVAFIDRWDIDEGASAAQ